MIPEQFKERMKVILKDDYDAFIDALAQPRTNAFRLNPLKANENTLKFLSPFDPAPIAHVSGGYRYRGEHIGNTPPHHGGAIYVQDAGAMCPVEALTLKVGMRVLDACAAPGGKSTQAAAKSETRGC